MVPLKYFVIGKSEIQKVVEEHARQGSINDDNSSMAEALDDMQDKIERMGELIKKGNKSEDWLNDKDSDEYHKLQKELVKEMFEAAIQDIDFWRNENPDMIMDVVRDTGGVIYG